MKKITPSYIIWCDFLISIFTMDIDRMTTV